MPSSLAALKDKTGVRARQGFSKLAFSLTLSFRTLVVSVRFALGEYATDEDAGTMSVNLAAVGLSELNCSGPVNVTVWLANRDFDATPFDISLGKPPSEIDLVQ